MKNTDRSSSQSNSAKRTMDGMSNNMRVLPVTVASLILLLQSSSCSAFVPTARRTMDIYSSVSTRKRIMFLDDYHYDKESTASNTYTDSNSVLSQTTLFSSVRYEDLNVSDNSTKPGQVDSNDNKKTDNAKATVMMAANAADAMDQVFDTVDVDGSGSIDIDEFFNHLTSIENKNIGRKGKFTRDAIQSAFSRMDYDQSGEITKDEFRRAIQEFKPTLTINNENDVDKNYVESCPMGYFYNAVQQTCEPLGIMGRISQKFEMFGPFRRIYQRISNLFGVDKKQIKALGVSFLLSYSIISNLNGAMSFSVAWYISCKRTGLSPLVPGQWKSLLSSYAMIYGAIQLLRPFRVAAAVAMSKLSAEYLDMTQSRLQCSRGVAIGFQYVMGQVVMGICALIGITIVSFVTGVPLRG